MPNKLPSQDLKSKAVYRSLGPTMAMISLEFHTSSTKVGSSLQSGVWGQVSHFARIPDRPHGVAGHFFQDRVKTITSDTGSHLLEVCRYALYARPSQTSMTNGKPDPGTGPSCARIPQSDPEWIKARRETEKEGPLVQSVTNMFLGPTSYSSLK